MAALRHAFRPSIPPCLHTTVRSRRKDDVHFRSNCLRRPVVKCAIGIDPKQATAAPKETPATLEPLKSNGSIDRQPEREPVSEETKLVSNEAAVGGSAVITGLFVVLILAIAGGGYVFRDQINDLLDYFTVYIEEAGPSGYVAFLLGYSALEVLAIPAIPLTMSAGLLFGPAVGTVLCSLAGVVSATIAFLIARYLARDRIQHLVEGNPKYAAIDKAVGENSLKVVMLLRLSPLLPFSLGNYMYGLTSVKLWPYVLGSWLGMLPGTWAYVSAGAFGRSLLEADDGQAAFSNSSIWALAAGLGITALAATYVTNLAKDAMKDIDDAK